MSSSKKTTVMQAVLRYVDIPKATAFERVKEEKGFSEEIINALRESIKQKE